MKKYILLACLAMSQGAFAGDVVSQLALSKKLSPIESSTQYYQPTQRWTSTDKMENVYKNKKFSDIEKSYRFHYLTNNNESNAVKGVVRKYVSGQKQSKHDMLEFVVLPGNTVYLGRFLPNVDFKIGEVTIVKKEDLSALEASQKLQKARISD
ncbi:MULTISPECIES: hypothetical protein [unclassified Colwellia]|uniref:hypothetical protein n=1 Tax=unclassified Colwellia TaxID=196834 RepID=UPI0015F412BB|nr:MULTISPECIES: hypothetical protein [unclassified Colwellia]MBA6231223.1 hypothetical protein [Colwellia sp. MB02u-7]MBA6238331.1 hypothetical protein [Colwellia sp. MB02u-11]MBA6255105.1 hypothetical protein [Colwellia sp. MB3u-28]MBA6260680.1 hypothetical protein [Colwellia sp. MB3u-41]MBA6299052.1 hypothetical protein [Colwellia sp. MB3u-22]